jgi:surface polysaccharide O-acyltransferase-like enzyme
MRLLALVGVILIHAGAAAYLESGASYALTVSYAGRYAIPVFFTVAAILQSRTSTHRSPSVHIIRRARRLVVPYVIWTGVYFAAGMLLKGGYEYGLGELLFYGGGFGFHLWFLIALFVFDTLAVLIPARSARTVLVVVLAVNSILRYSGVWTSPIDTYFVSAVPWTDWLLLYFAMLLLADFLVASPGRILTGVGLVLGSGLVSVVARVPLGELGWIAMAEQALVSLLCVVGVTQAIGWRTPAEPRLAKWSELILGIYILHYGVIKVLVLLVPPPEATPLGLVYLAGVVMVTLFASAALVRLWGRATERFLPRWGGLG